MAELIALDNVTAGYGESVVRQEVAVTVGLTVDAVVVDRMIVRGCELKGREERLGHGARRDEETFADHEVVEVPRRRQAMSLGRELGVGHARAVERFRPRRGGAADHVHERPHRYRPRQSAQPAGGRGHRRNGREPTTHRLFSAERGGGL